MSLPDPITIAILSQNHRLYSTRRLFEAARKRGHNCKVLDTLKFGIYVDSKHPRLTYRGQLLEHYDAILPRIGSSIGFYGSAVVRQFEQMGVFSLNSSAAISVARDKLRSMQVLSRHDIGIASSAFVREKADVPLAISQMGGAPVIIKLLEGTQGVGVILAESEKMAETIVETLQSTRQNVLMQRFIKESKGRDIRAFVVGDQVVAAMRRRAVGTEFRSNVHRGGTTEAVKLDEAYTRTAVRAAQIIGLRVAGVDMLEGRDGPVIMEVNSSPGLEGIEAATGFDVAGSVIDYLAEHVRYGDPDVRERLSLTKGYAVVEFKVTDHSPLVGVTLSDSGLAQRGVLVMNINRMGQQFPVPKGSDQICVGDELLCYGPKLALRSYMPSLDKKRPKPVKEEGLDERQ